MEREGREVLRGPQPQPWSWEEESLAGCFWSRLCSWLPPSGWGVGSWEALSLGEADSLVGSGVVVVSAAFSAGGGSLWGSGGLASVVGSGEGSALQVVVRVIV